jgi:eukaryotic-like serine/threonine-protein kinase
VSGITSDTVVDGRYRLVNRIGSGGMADVWCAEDLQLGRKVALKLLHPRFSEDQEFIERFRREASSAAGLQHPNVVSVYDRGEWEGTYYIAMEFLEGESLKDIVVRDAPLDPYQAIELTLQILRAARFAHRRGIVHRDFKPHNVIVDHEGRAKVTDFGIARSGASDMTQTGSIMGTAQYLSPEQAQGQAVSGSSDLYAIGIVLYELLTGQVPFDGESAVTIALKQVSEAPVPPSHLNPAVWPELEVVVLRALEKDPLMRFADADEFIAALEAARNGALPPETATTAFAAVPEVHTGEVLAPLVEDPRGGRRWWLWSLIAALAVAAAVIAAILLTRAETTPVPTVVGADVADAARRLRNDGFRPVVERVRNSAERDEVIGQDPEPGTELEVGEEVTLTVSDGPGTRAVPDVEGRTREQARSRLRDAGFRIRERRETSTEVDENRVIRTLPPIGSEVEVGATVTIVLSSGPEQVTVPDLSGQTLDDARERLRDLGLEADVSREESEDAEAGTVLRQEPEAGSAVDEGSTVELIVAEEPEAVEVPDVEGESQERAAELLSGAGLEVDVETVAVEQPSQDGVVQSQSPGGGERLERGQRVTIEVGRFDDSQVGPDAPPEEEGTGGAADPGDGTTGGAAGEGER